MIPKGNVESGGRAASAWHVRFLWGDVCAGWSWDSLGVETRCGWLRSNATVSLSQLGEERTSQDVPFYRGALQAARLAGGVNFLSFFLFCTNLIQFLLLTSQVSTDH